MKAIFMVICFLTPRVFCFSQPTNIQENTGVGSNLHNSYTFPSCGLPVKKGTYSKGPIKSIYVSMRDSVKIALDIVLPNRADSSAQVPTILMMTRYWRSVEGGGYTQEQNFFSSHGYAVVTGDVRGTGASFGVWPYHRSRQETLDFEEIIEWITQQPWSNGAVMGWGSSYSANTADWMAERNHPALTAVVSRFPDYDPYTDLYFPGGVPNAFMSETWGMRVKDLDLNVKQKSSDGVLQGVRPVDEDTNHTMLHEAIEARRNVPSVWEGLKQVTYRDDQPESWHGASFDDWGIYAKNRLVEQSGVPIQSWGSWMDAGTANGVIHRFMSLANPQRAFVGAWAHGSSPNASPFTLHSQSEDPAFPVQIVEGLCFLNEHAGKRDSSANEPGVPKLLMYYTIGEERWKTTTEWPLPQTQWESWYFGSSNQLFNDSSKQDHPAKDPYVVDFSTSTGEKNRWATNNGGGAVDYGNRAEADKHLLTYTSQPLPQDTEITGHPRVELFVTSTHSDGAFFVYLEDVSPDGVVTYLTEGELRAIHRKISQEEAPYQIIGPYHSFLKRDAQPLIPGKVAKLEFQLFPISVRLQAGHRIRVAIAGADKDTFSRIPSTGHPIIHVFRGKDYASRVILPIIPH